MARTGDKRRIRHGDFLEVAPRDPHEPCGAVLPRQGVRLGQCGHQIVIAADGPLHNGREERDKQRVSGYIALCLCLAPVYVYDIGGRPEGVEGDTEREQQGGRPDIPGAEQSPDASGDGQSKAGVLQHCQYGEIQHKAEDQYPAAYALSGGAARFALLARQFRPCGGKRRRIAVGVRLHPACGGVGGEDAEARKGRYHPSPHA